MTRARLLAVVLGERRLDLRWMSRGDRRLARLGVGGTAVSAAGVMTAGLTHSSATVDTVLGEKVVVALWVTVAVYLGLALSAGLLVRSTRSGRWRARAVGGLLAVQAAAAIQALRPISAAETGLALPLAVAGVLGWLVLGWGLALAATGKTKNAPVRMPAAASAGFWVLLLSHLFAVVGSRTLPDTTRALLTDGLWSTATELSAWLALFAAWQVTEGLHASKDSAAAGMGKVSLRWLPWGLAAKIVLLVVGFLLLAPAEFPNWEDARSAHPFAWAYALVVAAAAVLWIRYPVGPLPDRRSVLRGAVAVVAVWSAPFLLGFALVGLGRLVLLFIPESLGDLAVYSLAAAVSLLSSRWLRGVRIGWRAWLLAASPAVLSVLASSSSPDWFPGVRADGIATLASWVESTSDVADEWQVWGMLALPFMAAGWLSRLSSHRTVAFAVLVIGIWNLPRAVAVMLRDVLEVRIAPNLLMLDVALTLVGLWWLLVPWRTEGRPPGDVRAVGLLVAVLTVVTYGVEFGGPLVGRLSDGIGSLVGLDAAALAFVTLLVLPGVYALAFDSQELNRARSADGVFTALGASSLLLAVALVLVPLGVMAPGVGMGDLIRLLVLPGLALIAALEPLKHSNPDDSNAGQR